MKFKTNLLPVSSEQKINLSQQSLTIGSCFSESIGQKLTENKFDTLVNPFGTLFDPLSIIRLLKYSVENTSPEESTYIESDGVIKNLEFHSSFNGLSQQELALKIKASLNTTHSFLKSANWLIITLGTASVYKYTLTSNYVANCQKLPAINFTNELLSLELIIKSFEDFFNVINAFNPELNIILTVSPVRHIKDGLMQNNLSKSILRISCEELSKKFDKVQYYPAYELMIDDLRDYRYYKEDMIHPSDQAIDYIWRHFINSYMDIAVNEFIEKWNKISNALNHRPFNPSTPEHQKFLKSTLDEILLLQDLVNVEKEIAYLEERLN